MPEEMLRTLEEQVKPEYTALIIVDPQKDFCASDGLAGKVFGWDMSRIQAAVPRLNHFIQKARDAGVNVIWIKGMGGDRMRRNYIPILEEHQTVVARRGDGTDWYSEVVKPLPEEQVIVKWHYDAFEYTNLHPVLQDKGIRTLLFTGFTANVCVETSARHGCVKGYNIVLVSDCVDAPTKQEYKTTLFNIKTYFGRVATSNEIIKAWQ